MEQPRVLILDTESLPGHHLIDLVTEDLPIVTATSNADLLTRMSMEYMASERAMELARTAQLDRYDFVIIGNNEGVGLTLAALIPEEMRPRTLIVWFFDSSRREVPGYVALGYSHFESRDRQGIWYAAQLASLRGSS